MSSFERSLEQKGKDEYIKNSCFENRNVLIGTLSSKEQLDINLKNKFYHTKLKNINLKKNSIDIIAIAQSKTLFKEDGGIKYYGKVKYIKIVKRSEIKEIPKESDELYIRFQIEEWKELNKKIEIKGFNVRNIIYTTEYLLHNADIVTELCIKSKEEFRLWSELKRLQGDIVSNIDKDIKDNSIIQGFNFEDSEIYISGDNIKVVKDGQVNEFMIDELRKGPRRVIRKIVSAIRNV